MKETFFFSHDYNARSDPKIKKLLRIHGWEGYGIFWSLVEDLYSNDNCLELDYDLISYDLRANIDLVKSVINDFELFAIEGNTFGSASIQKRLDERDSKSKKARASARKRWNNKDDDTQNEENESADEVQTHSDDNANALRPHYENNTDVIRQDEEGNTIYIYNIDSIDKYKGEDINNNKPSSSVYFRYRVGVLAAKDLFELDIGKIDRLRKEVKGLTDEIMEAEFLEIKRWIYSRPENTWPTAYGMTNFIRKWLIGAIKKLTNKKSSKNGNNTNAFEAYKSNRAKLEADLKGSDNA